MVVGGFGGVERFGWGFMVVGEVLRLGSGRNSARGEKFFLTGVGVSWYHILYSS